MLRHPVEIQRKVAAGDGFTWETWKRVMAEVRNLSAREFMSFDQTLGHVEATIRIWFIDGVDPTMRIRHGEVIYSILGVLPDNMSGRQYIVLPVSRGTNEG